MVTRISPDADEDTNKLAAAVTRYAREKRLILIRAPHRENVYATPHVAFVEALFERTDRSGQMIVDNYTPITQLLELFADVERDRRVGALLYMGVLDPFIIPKPPEGLTKPILPKVPWKQIVLIDEIEDRARTPTDSVDLTILQWVVRARVELDNKGGTVNIAMPQPLKLAG